MGCGNCYQGTATLEEGEHGYERNLAKAAALGNALLMCVFVPWAICLLIYTGEYAEQCATKGPMCCTCTLVTELPSPKVPHCLWILAHADCMR